LGSWGQLNGLDIKMGPFKNLAILAFIAITTTNALPGIGREALQQKTGRIGIFNVVRFPNDVCTGTGSMNGTCYTAEECSNRDGTEAGSCADGFGVCCVISVSCGGTTSENCTYLSMASTTTTPTDNPCSYTICPLSTSVSRIRLDLEKFVLAAPGAVTLASLSTTETSQGACNTDTFTVTSSGKQAPVICGTNTGQHMIVDSNGKDCISANFVFGGDATTREYNIHVTQYDKMNTMGGPTGCLQYFTGTSGTISTFNWVDRTSVHLQNQDYTVCIRQNAGVCGVCYSETATTWAAITGTFGVAITSIAATSEALAGTSCTTDFVLIPNSIATGLTASTAAATLKSTTVTVSATDGKHCGRLLAAASGTTGISVCSNVTPFTLGVVFDGTEAGADDATAMADTDEGSPAATNNPLGTNGFQLGFTQISCS